MSLTHSYLNLEDVCGRGTSGCLWQGPLGVQDVKKTLRDVSGKGTRSQKMLLLRPRQKRWSGIVGLITLAPPCRGYSRLKLKPGGLRACAHQGT